MNRAGAVSEPMSRAERRNVDLAGELNTMFPEGQWTSAGRCRWTSAVDSDEPCSLLLLVPEGGGTKRLGRRQGPFVAELHHGTKGVLSSTRPHPEWDGALLQLKAQLRVLEELWGSKAPEWLTEAIFVLSS